MAPAREPGGKRHGGAFERSRDGLKLFVVDPHTIYRRGLAACLEGLPEVQSVGQAGGVRQAWDDEALLASDLVLVDHAMTGGLEFVAAVGDATGAAVVVCSSLCTEEAVLAALQAGAVGVLRKDTLGVESLGNAVRAAANGTGVVTSELLHELLDGLAPNGYEKASAARLSEREQQVLSLIADGHPTREVAQQLCYSERTVKNVLHDVVTKLGARSRSQAVAHAVREGLI
jgi:DNA-binding NarL/FixJ family response regulator